MERARKDFGKKMLGHLFSTFMLWLISKEPLHGYELIKRIQDQKHLGAVGPAQVYPVLKGLTKSGLLAHEKAVQGKRVRKVYHITPKGREMLRNARRCLAENPLKRQFLREMAE